MAVVEFNKSEQVRRRKLIREGVGGVNGTGDNSRQRQVDRLTKLINQSDSKMPTKRNKWPR